jgi:hypothetical protein
MARATVTKRNFKSHRLKKPQNDRGRNNNGNYNRKTKFHDNLLMMFTDIHAREETPLFPSLHYRPANLAILE